ncbi:MAG: arylesterase [Lysobacterales bacterium]|jgi:acyl-CoA thioesterase-1
MKFILTVLLFVISPLVNAEEPPVILVLGDSLSAGYGMDREQSWVALLEARLQQDGHAFRVFNSSISGDTTQGGLTRLPGLLQRLQPRFVIIELGGNDGLRGLRPSITRRNITSMIEQSQASGARVLLAGIKLPPNYGAAYIEQFESIYPDLASEFGTLLVPFFMQGVVFESGMMQDDGIHPSAAAQPVLLENVWSVLAPELDG